MKTWNMTPDQIQNAYKSAVKSSLVAFYAKPPQEAERLVAQWWARISNSDDVRSGAFLHTEVLGTATDLAKTREVQLTDEVRKRYLHILQESSEAALMGQRTRQRQKALETAQKKVVRVAS